jgi:hypothetical protein
LDKREHAHAELCERCIYLGLVGPEGGRELGLVEVGRALGLREGDVEEEEHFEKVVEGDPDVERRISILGSETEEQEERTRRQAILRDTQRR